MRALLSGQAGVAVVLGSRPEVRQVHGGVSQAWHLADVLRLFDGCGDVRAVSVTSSAEVDEKARLAWANDRALRLTLFLLDPAEPGEDLQEYAECIEELLAEYQLGEQLERRLTSALLPNSVDLARVEKACASAPLVWKFIKGIVAVQPLIGQVRAAFDAVSSAPLGGVKEKEALREALIDDGAFRDVTKALDEDRSLSFLKLQIASRHRAQSAAISQWLGTLQPNLKRLPAAVTNEDPDEWLEEQWDDKESTYPSHEAFTQVRSQQHGIVEKLKQRDVDGAGWLTRELIKFQQRFSTVEQIAKSLCAMAQQAKRHEIPELQLEWAEWATNENPLDPVTFGHLADALISVGRLFDAEKALDSVEQAGDLCYAATGRARVLRAMGRLSQARQAFLDIIEKYPDHQGIEYAWIGAAETLREMGDVETALDEYKSLAERYSSNGAAWAGLASTLMDLGRLDEAIVAFGKAAAHDSRAVSMNGQATVYKLAGDFEKALRLYSQVLREFPNNHVGLCGRAEVLRAQGHSADALSAYDEAIRRSPYSLVPLSGKANLLRELGKFEDAAALFEQGRENFPYDPAMPLGLVGILRKQGRYAEALKAIDEMISQFPFNLQARVLRASILFRLGEDQEALKAFDAILSNRPYVMGAILGKAALLIRLGRFSEAEQLLPVTPPDSQIQWKCFAMRAFLIERQEGADAAVHLLRDGVKSCPFAQERSSMRDLLATLELGLGRRSKARQLVDSALSETSNVVALHVFAATRQREQAQEQLRRILHTPGPAKVIELAEEIARRYRLVGGPPRHNNAWIAITEREILLAEAA